MTKLILEKGKNFDSASQFFKKEKFDELAGKEFENLDELFTELYKNRGLPFSIYLPKEREVKIDTLPYTIKEWPLFWSRGPAPYGVYEIAKIRVVE